MLASLLGCITSRHRAWAFALLWLLVLTIVNVQTGGAFRSTVLFAIPVAAVSWNDWRLGFVFAAASVLCAKFGGAIPEPGSPSPLWLDGMLAFTKLSIDAAVANAWGRRYRRRASQARESEDVQHRGGSQHHR
jgi:hypothetical protein